MQERGPIHCCNNCSPIHLSSHSPDGMYSYQKFPRTKSNGSGPFMPSEIAAICMSCSFVITTIFKGLSAFDVHTTNRM